MGSISASSEQWASSGGSLSSVLEELAAAPRLDPAELEARRLKAGDRIGRFEILREVGRGSFGVVYQARDTELGRHVAVKAVRFDSLAGEQGKRLGQFRREAEMAARLHHPNIVTLHDVGLREGVPYLVLELLEGETLESRLARAAFPPGEALEVVVQIARALVHAHASGIVHRDLKPANVFLGSDGQVKVLDFGLARLFGGDGSRGGTPAFMAPEQWRKEPEDDRTDVFGFGVLLYTMLSSTLPFANRGEALEDRPAPLVTSPFSPLPEELAQLVARMLAKDRAGRPDAPALLRDLLLLRDGRAREGAAGDRPYRYLETFGDSDAAFFFGREQEARQLQHFVEQRPLTCIVGPSGAGKSSLVRAGLLPRLRRSGTRAIVLHPGNEPLDALASSGASIAAEVLAGKPGLFGEHLRELAKRGGQKLLVFVDQLEELYTLVADVDRRRAFAAAIASAGDDAAGPLRVVVAVREDFLSRLSESPELRDRAAAGIFLLGRPEAPALAEAIRGPALSLGFSFEEGLVEEMTAQLGREASPLPLLQLATSRLWEKRDPERKLIPRAALARLGGLGGVLATHADEVARGLTGPAELKVARQMLYRLLTPEGTRRQSTPDALLASFPDSALAKGVLQRLIDGRLLTSSRGDRGEVVEIAHESLIAGWHQLRTWFAEEREAARRQDQLARAAAGWEARRKGKKFLWSGEELEDALRWHEQHDVSLLPLQRQFLEASADVVRRAGRRRKQAAFVAAAVALLALGGAAFGVHVIRRMLWESRREDVARAAEAHPDPLAGALLLAELAREGEPPGGAAAAATVVRKRIPRAELRGHEGLVMQAAFSPDGARVASASRDGTARVWNADGRGDPVILRGHTGPLSGVAFSPDGSTIATASADGTARLWRGERSRTTRAERASSPGPPTERRGYGRRAAKARPWCCAEPVFICSTRHSVPTDRGSLQGTRLAALGPGAATAAEGPSRWPVTPLYAWCASAPTDTPS
jgi:hypothetical protein